MTQQRETRLDGTTTTETRETPMSSEQAQPSIQPIPKPERLRVVLENIARLGATTGEAATPDQARRSDDGTGVFADDGALSYALREGLVRREGELPEPPLRSRRPYRLTEPGWQRLMELVREG